MAQGQLLPFAYKKKTQINLLILDDFVEKAYDLRRRLNLVPSPGQVSELNSLSNQRREFLNPMICCILPENTAMNLEQNRKACRNSEWLLRKIEAYKANGPLEKSEMDNLLCSTEIENIPIVQWYKSSDILKNESPIPYIHGVLIGVFSAEYNKNLNGEIICFDVVAVNTYLKENYKSPAVAINVFASSSGIQAPRSVAIFPENFVWPKVNLTQCPVFYFINKFVSRFYEFTKKAICSKIVDENSFPFLIESSMNDILIAAVSWVHLHEYFHDQGSLPYTENRTIKSSRSTAAFEELRVDILTIIEAFDVLSLTEYGFKASVLLAEFVFSERLLSYPLQANPDSDYDARSSQVLLILLIKYGAFDMNSAKFSIDWQILRPVLKSIANEIDLLEREAASLSVQKARDLIGGFVTDNSIIDPSSKMYLQHHFFKSLRKNVNIR